MHAATFVSIGIALVLSQDTDAARRAIAIVRQAEGTIVYDDKAPGRPVVAVNL